MTCQCGHPRGAHTAAGKQKWCTEFKCQCKRFMWNGRLGTFVIKPKSKSKKDKKTAEALTKFVNWWVRENQKSSKFN